MLKISNALLPLFLSVSLVAETTPPAPTISCEVTRTVEHQAIGDELGHTVLTSKKVYRDCTETAIVQGPCIKWEDKELSIKQEYLAEIGKISIDHSGNLAEALTTFDAMNRASNLFNGVKGYCEIGPTQNFNWLDDPAMWAGLILSFAGGGAFGDTLKGIGETMSTGYGGCLVGGALDMMSTAADISMPDPDCDPVDEFCDDDSSTDNGPGEVQTLTVDEYNGMITKEPDIVNYIEVLDDGSDTGYVVFEFKPASQLVDTSAMDSEEAKAAKEEAEQKALETKAAVTTVKVVACAGSEYSDFLGSGGDNVDGGSQGDQPDVGSTIANVIAGKLPFPYNVIASLVLKIFNSFDEIDSCNDEDDAQSQGPRHEMAYRGMRFDTCHPVNDEVVDEIVMMGERVGYTYCCYASPMTKILMVQMKAQVGEGYAHCTGISLRELSTLSWRQCTAEEMASAQDGAELYGEDGVDYDMTESFQYKYRCMDLRPLKEYVESQVPVDFDTTMVSEMIERLDPDWVK